MISIGAILALLWLTVMARRAVLGGARAAAAGDDLVLHIALARPSVLRPPMMIERLPLPSARTFSGTIGRKRREQRIDQRVHGRIVGVDRRRKTRIEHAALARGEC